jgi:hypothetical protein
MRRHRARFRKKSGGMRRVYHGPRDVQRLHCAPQVRLAVESDEGVTHSAGNERVARERTDAPTRPSPAVRYAVFLRRRQRGRFITNACEALAASNDDVSTFRANVLRFSPRFPPTPFSFFFVRVCIPSEASPMIANANAAS